MDDSPPSALVAVRAVLVPVMTVHGNVISFDLVMQTANDGTLVFGLGLSEFQHWIAAAKGDLIPQLLDQFSALMKWRDTDAFCRPHIMGILNVTPDSFSDGGQDNTSDDAIRRGCALAAAGADVIDVGGESTRPGAAEVPVDEELARVIPVVRGLVAAGLRVSIDTRKAPVMQAAVAAGASIINDVSALTFDPGAMDVAARCDAEIVLMHAQGLPENMQDDPQYSDVVLDVFHALKARVSACEQAGIKREKLIVDPGIGFGKTVHQNLQLLHHGAMLHGLGSRVLMGASRKSVIGAVTGEEIASRRVAGSVAIANWSQMLGLQMVRVHDVAETRQALEMLQACRGGR